MSLWYNSCYLPILSMNSADVHIVWDTQIFLTFTWRLSSGTPLQKNVYGVLEPCLLMFEILESSLIQYYHIV